MQFFRAERTNVFLLRTLRVLLLVFSVFPNIGVYLCINFACLTLRMRREKTPDHFQLDDLSYDCKRLLKKQQRISYCIPC